LVIVVLGFFYFAMLSGLFSGAPFIPTGRQDIARIFVQIMVRPGEVFYELGSGDGRVVRAAARAEARAIGIEQSGVLIWWSRLLTRGVGVPSGHLAARFIHASFFKVDLSAADTVFCYLLPTLMERLKSKLERELKPGARVISYAFKMPGWTPVQRLSLSRRNLPAYVYEMSKERIIET